MRIIEYQTYREEEILPLYASVGWTAYTDARDALRRGFVKSLLTLAAYEEKTLVGLVRAVGDGETVVLVQDLLVFPPASTTRYRHSTDARDDGSFCKRPPVSTFDRRHGKNARILPLARSARPFVAWLSGLYALIRRITGKTIHNEKETGICLSLFVCKDFIFPRRVRRRACSKRRCRAARDFSGSARRDPWP